MFPDEYDPEVLDEQRDFSADERAALSGLRSDLDNERYYNVPFSAINDPWWDSDPEGY